MDTFYYQYFKYGMKVKFVYINGKTAYKYKQTHIPVQICNLKIKSIQCYECVCMN